ncbi:MAG: alanine/ornithine racemase family PLP-dependent enzyme [Bacteroidetes bacterium]|jgi:ornithine racemase|nr:alanine/ornithine racemase family PLP-dependent enzyme [Bacteroidota bacterium]MBT5528986.1 alanine/ornithine racemase family PLP-dependent enzyme [Cytophagia bacterium]MBT4727931.1 alanine/ornithine racemase family PLP-dependent enzyme [Bacteroidota bacterium]MBT5992706.1 alanine/ornithine racemase family PLP-dependent enzyme [Bacteroidota bacterium]MBT6835335.1 alanine/ornithine racemase family PLP-dependent enzyme [Bacteroidota bacterium]
MAEIRVKTKAIIGNIEKLYKILSKHDIQWTLVVKMLSGNDGILTKILNAPEIDKIHSIGDSRLSGLKKIKQIRPDIKTMYIKPTPIQFAKTVVEYADFSVHTSFTAIKAISAAAVAQKKQHKIIIMIELGELREGIMRENLIEFYNNVFELPNIEIVGLGTNLGCMYGIEPTYDKMIQLSLYKQLIEARFNKKLDLISGGSSITLPLIKKQFPKSVNHFRIGESIFMGVSPLDGKKFESLSIDAFEYSATIIELEEKESIPDGVISDANVGHTSDEVHDADDFSKSFKAILDFGSIDVDHTELIPKDKSIEFIGTTSDMTVYELGTNKKPNGQPKYKIGQKVRFTPSYMAVARLMNSKYIEKNII